MKLLVEKVPYPNLHMSVDEALELARDLIRAAQLAMQIKQPHIRSTPMILNERTPSALVLTVAERKDKVNE